MGATIYHNSLSHLFTCYRSTSSSHVLNLSSTRALTIVNQLLQCWRPTYFAGVPLPVDPLCPSNALPTPSFTVVIVLVCHLVGYLISMVRQTYDVVLASDNSNATPNSSWISSINPFCATLRFRVLGFHEIWEFTKNYLGFFIDNLYVTIKVLIWAFTCLGDSLKFTRRVLEPSFVSTDNSFVTVWIRFYS